MLFAHLHVHSYFSLLDGAAPVRELCLAAREMGMTALALTDHNGLYGAVRFFQAAKEAGIKPIIGAEFDVERQEAGDRRQGKRHISFCSQRTTRGIRTCAAW